MKLNNWTAEVVTHKYDDISDRVFFVVSCTNSLLNYGWTYVIDNDDLVWLDRVNYCDESCFALTDGIRNYYDCDYECYWAYDIEHNEVITLQAACEAINNYKRNLGNATKF